MYCDKENILRESVVMRKWWIALTAAMLLYLLPVSALAVPSNLWDKNNVYVISGVHESNVEVGIYGEDEYYLVLDHAELKQGIALVRMPSSKNPPTIHLMVKGENRIIGGGIFCNTAIQLIIEPASWDASLMIESSNYAIAINGSVACNGFGYEDFEPIYPHYREYRGPEFIVPIPGTSAANHLPATGDGSNLMLWFGMLAASAAGMLTITRRARREY